MADRVIGIDLGTTNCCVAVVDGLTPRVIPNKGGYKTTPSVVAIAEDGRRLVGQIASRQAVTNPANTVYAAKRLIGRRWDSPQVKHAIEHMTYQIVQGPRDDVRVVLGEKQYSVPEISAMLLQEMRLIAEDHLHESVQKAVITVPAYFNDSQREAVRDAGRIAGLEVPRIINEPTAAALAYGFNKGENLTIVVYDLGGGTFDISVVKLSADGTFRVVSTTGDSYLGGEDYDDRIMQWMLKKFEAEHGVDLLESPVAVQRVKQAAQKAKCDLSTLDTAEVQLPFIVSSGPTGPVHLNYALTRKELEDLTGDLTTRTLRICEKALQQVGIRTAEIDEVILVGGMTRMPAVQFAVAQFFGKEPCKGVHPDEVVALGAAIQGAALAQEGAQQPQRRDVALHDVTAHSSGIMVAGGAFDVLIPLNAPVPTKVKSIFTTSRDNQGSMKIVVLQGESSTARENELVGQFMLSQIRPAPAGQVEVEVTFTIDADGVFSVSALDLETGEEQSIEVSGRSRLTEDELRSMIADGASYFAERRAHESQERLKQTAETTLAEIERLIPAAERKIAWNPVGTEGVDQARAVLADAKVWLADGDLDDARVTRLEQARLLLRKVIDA